MNKVTTKSKEAIGVKLGQIYQLVGNSDIYKGHFYMVASVQGEYVLLSLNNGEHWKTSNNIKELFGGADFVRVNEPVTITPGG